MSEQRLEMTLEDRNTVEERNLMPQGTQFRQISYPQTAAGVSEHVVLGMIAILLLSLFHSIAFLRNKGDEVSTLNSFLYFLT